MIHPLVATYFVWFAWAVSWWLAATWSSKAERRPGVGREFFYRITTVAGGVMLFAQAPRLNTYPLWHTPEPLAWTCVALTAAGFLFCWWARIHLGRLWSGSVTKKADHRVVDTGPYRFVRHPIYTGIILASYATAAEKGTALAFTGASVMLLGWYVKARLEERFLRQELGHDAYDAYAARVPMLIPFAPV